MVGLVSAVAKTASGMEILLAGGDLLWSARLAELNRAAFGHAASNLGLWTLPAVSLAQPRQSHREAVSHAGISGQSYTEVAAALRTRLLDEIEQHALVTGDEATTEEWSRRFQDWFDPASIWRQNVLREFGKEAREVSNVQEADLAYVRIDRAFEPLIAGAQVEFNAVAAAHKDRRLELERVRAPLDAMVGNMVAMHQMFTSSHVGLSTGREERTFDSSRSQLAERIAAFDVAFPVVRHLFRSEHSAAVTTLGRSSACFAEAVRLHASNHLHAKNITDLLSGSQFTALFPEYVLWQPSTSAPSELATETPSVGYLGLMVDPTTGAITREGYPRQIHFRPGTDDMRTFMLAFKAQEKGVSNEEWKSGYRADWHFRHKLKSGVNKELKRLGLRIDGSDPMTLKKIEDLPKR
jgi:hypothetical protein